MPNTTMGTFAVSWWVEGEAPKAGRLELGETAARFSARRGDPLVIPLDAVTEVRIDRPATQHTIARPTLVVQRGDGPSISVQSVVGFAVLHEVADALAPTHPQAA